MLISKSFKIQLVTLLFLLLSFNAYSQTVSSDSLDCITNKSDFEFDLYFINGYALGYNLHSYQNSELRVILELESGAGSSKSDNLSHWNNGAVHTTRGHSVEAENNSHNLSLSLHYLFNIYKSNYGSIYLGIGPRIGYDWGNSSSSSINSDSATKMEFKSDFQTKSIGITAIAGLRSNITDRINLFAEMQLTGYRNWQTFVNNQTYTDTTIGSAVFEESNNTNKEKGWGYYYTYAKVGIRFSL